MNLVFRNSKTGVVRECSLEKITSLGKLDTSEMTYIPLKGDKATIIYD